MTRKKDKKAAAPERNMEAIKKDLEKTGEAAGDLLKNLFKGVGRVFDIVQEMEEKGEKERTVRKEIKGFTKSGKEFHGEAGWRVRTGLLEAFPKKKDENK